ncbi:MAG: tRNA uracil 4-sulfurtransferase ThiI [Fervidicoccaceae archaeon]
MGAIGALVEEGLKRGSGWAEPALLVRFGEIAVKGSYSRRKMQRLLLDNLERALDARGVSRAGIRIEEGRIIVSRPEPMERAVEAATRVFGVVSASPCLVFEASSLEEIAEKSVELLGSSFVGKKIKVEARRVGRHDFTSLDVARRLGSAMLERGASGVDLERPEYTVRVEVRGKRVFLYDSVAEGPGGLPLGSEGRVLALISGGFDSAVAAWMMMKRGARADFAFFNIGGEEHAKVAREVACYLAREWSFGHEPRLLEVELRWMLPLLELKFPEGFRHVALKIAMYVGAEALAKKYGARALVTGESLAQVSSQTLHNLVVTEEYVEVPVLRPLIGMDKEEIIRLAKRIGTHDISVKSREFCALASPRASTSVDRDKLASLMAEHAPKDVIVERALSYHRELRLPRDCAEPPGPASSA